jgi:hypothetical protein
MPENADLKYLGLNILYLYILVLYVVFLIRSFMKSPMNAIVKSSRIQCVFANNNNWLKKKTIQKDTVLPILGS